MAVAVDNTSEAKAGSTDTLTFSHTVPTGSDLCLYLGIGMRLSSAFTFDTVTYDGDALTEKFSGNTGFYGTAGFYKTTGLSTGANTVSIIFGESQSWLTAGATSFTGVDQSSPLGTEVVDSSGSTTSLDVDVTSESGAVVIDTIMVKQGPLVKDAGQTEEWLQICDTPYYVGGGSSKAGAATVNMSWSFTSGDGYLTGVSVNPAAGGSTEVTKAGTITPSGAPSRHFAGARAVAGEL